MRVSSKFLAVVATSGLMGLSVTPAQADPVVAPEASAGANLAQDGEAVNATSLVASDLREPLATPDDGATTLDFERLQPAPVIGTVSDTLQGAIDDYRPAASAPAPALPRLVHGDEPSRM